MQTVLASSLHTISVKLSPHFQIPFIVFDRINHIIFTSPFLVGFLLVFRKVVRLDLPHTLGVISKNNAQRKSRDAEAAAFEEYGSIFASENGLKAVSATGINRKSRALRNPPIRA